jgi:hypothetical protein
MTIDYSQWPSFCLGLAEPAKAAKGMAPTVDAMRKAIDAGQRDSHLICQCLGTARYAGMSGEDTYVLLAYQALLLLEQTHQRLASQINLMNVPPRLTK